MEQVAPRVLCGKGTCTEAAMNTDDYRVRLEAFEGPLDLLLFLIRKHEVDIHDIPIATIAEQFLAHVSQLGTGEHGLDMDFAGEFLVMAATLTEIKSRMLVPGERREHTQEAKAPEVDPRSELVRQLLEYKKYRDAAETLERRAAEWRNRLGNAPAARAVAREEDSAENRADEAIDLEDVELIDLVRAFQRIAETVQFDRLGDHKVTYDDTPIELHAEDLLLRAKEAPERELELRSVFQGRSKSEMVGLFLAMLELVRNRRLAVRQEKESGQIFVRVREDVNTTAGGTSEVEVSDAPPAIHVVGQVVASDESAATTSTVQD
jgi:segregation and condensation protein A